MGDHGVFHESMAELLSWRPRVPQEIYAAQMGGEKLSLSGQDDATVNQVLQDMPFWSAVSYPHLDVYKRQSLFRQKSGDDV